jgi:excisionase family DNA binding protein
MIATATGLSRAGGQRLPDYVSTEEAAEILGYHVKHIRDMAASGKLRADKKAGVWWIYRESVDEYRDSVAGKSKHDPTRGL